jgi:hypothetical protein
LNSFAAAPFLSASEKTCKDQEQTDFLSGLQPFELIEA